MPAEEVVTKDGLSNAKQETSEEMDQGAKASGIPNRDVEPEALELGAGIFAATPQRCALSPESAE